MTVVIAGMVSVAVLMQKIEPLVVVIVVLAVIKCVVPPKEKILVLV